MNDNEYTWPQTLWWLIKRFLRTVVPQIPALLAAADQWFTPDSVPYLVAAGGILTVLDKLFRDKGWYGVSKKK